MFSDGLTAIGAVYRRYGGKLVQVGDQVYPGRQGFIAPLNWKKEYIDEINEATFHLAEKDRLKTLDSYVKGRTKCDVKKSNSIDMKKLKIFFVSAFGSCLILLIHMIVNPQRTVDSDNATSQSSIINLLENSDENV